MASDLHKKPFDEGTLVKLEIFGDYAQAWIPTFVMSDVRKIAIFDLFAGQGYDTNGVPGSAIRVLQERENVKSRTLGSGARRLIFT